MLGASGDEVPRRVADELDNLLPLVGPAERADVNRRVLAALTGLGPLEEFLADPDTEDVMINAGTELWVARRGGTRRVGTLQPDVFWTVVERILTPLGLRLDRTHPSVDARLPDGSRLAAMIPPLAVDGPCLAIRRFRITQVDLDKVAAPEVARLLRHIVASRGNVVVCGATASGKTTLLNSLVGLIPPTERIVTIEDTAELDLGDRHVVRLEARVATESLAAVGIRELVRAALRLRPERLIVGEVRGAEALDMIEALSTGHDGSLSTVHANGPADALRRLEFMALQGAGDVPLAALRERVAEAVDVVIEIGRGPDGQRLIREVAEVRRGGDAGGERTRRLATGAHVIGELQRQRQPC